MKASNTAVAAAIALPLLVAHPQEGSSQDGPPPFEARAIKYAPQKIVAVFAHPDDELVIAPALAFEARTGQKVTLVYATTGDQGPGVSGMKPGAQLGRKRMQEAACAKRALGADKLVSLDLGDGTLGVAARQEGSAAKRLLSLLPKLLDGAKVVFTWGPDGGYGHSDHRMVSALVTQYLQSLPETERPLLSYPAFVNAPLPEPLASQGWSITSPDLATRSYGYTDSDLAAAAKAAQCHKTQFDDATRKALVPLFDKQVWDGNVSFRPAF